MVTFLCVDAAGAETVLTEGKEYTATTPGLAKYIRVTDDKGQLNYFPKSRFLRADTMCAYKEN